MIKLDSPQPTYEVPAPDAIPDTAEDQPVGEDLTAGRDAADLPPLVFGAATLSTIYNKQDDLHSPGPLRTVRLALRYGIRAFDTSPYYGASEIILGSILKALEPEFPRSSYKLLTKCGRYGSSPEDFDYSPATIRASVTRSLKRLNTTYLDAVYLHDVEFVCAPVHPPYTATSPSPNTAGNHVIALSDPDAARDWGLSEDQVGKIHGPGDQIILDALGELHKMKQEGLIRAVGISGYPVPTLLRLSLLALDSSHLPVDILMSYSNSNLQNTTFLTYVPHLTQRAQIPQRCLLSASPFSMGLLTPNPPAWHPAPAALVDFVKNDLAKSDAVTNWEGGLPNLALGFAMRLGLGGGGMPTVVGLSSLKEVHECVAVWREIAQSQKGGGGNAAGDERKAAENAVVKLFEDGGWANLCWKSGL